MSDVEAEVDQDASEAAGDGDLPEMDPEEFADADLDELAEEIEAEAGATPDTSDVTEETPAEESDADQDGEADLTPSGESWGDMYVGTLTTVSNAIIEQHGTEEAEEIEEELARQLHLDAYFDEWMESRGKADMPPEQALLIGTTMFLVVVVGTKTDLPSKLLEEAEI